MASPANLFDQSHYADVRRPVLEARHLPPWCYTSDEFYQREVEQIFRKTWNFVGREDRIPNSGDYFTLKIGGVAVILVRNENRDIHAFANTCTHRGSRLLSDEGNCGKYIQCPYHSWSFALDGTLAAAPGMENAKGFDLRDYPLHPIRLETWESFLFINFAADGMSLAEYLGDLPDKLGCYNFSDMITVRRVEYDLACNWKLFIENAMEEYHTATVHKASVGKQEGLIEETEGQWEAAFMFGEKTIAVLPSDNSPFPHIPTLEGRPAQGTYFVLLKPSTMLGCTQDCMWWLEQHPQGPDRTRLIVGSCFPRSTVERADFDEVVQKYYARWDKSIPEDNWISEVQQAGLESPYSRTSRVSHKEVLVHTMANWVLDRVLDS